MNVSSRIVKFVQFGRIFNEITRFFDFLMRNVSNKLKAYVFNKKRMKQIFFDAKQMESYQVHEKSSLQAAAAIFK